MKQPVGVAALVDFGRIRLSKSFFMRDFLFSDILAMSGMADVSDETDLAIAARKGLCENLLQNRFGRLAICSSYRSCAVSAFGAEWQSAGKAGYPQH